MFHKTNSTTRNPRQRCLTRQRRLRLGLATVVCLGWCGWADAQQPVTVDPDQQLEAFLSRLGLVDLQLAHLEHVLEKEGNRESQLEAAKHLADLYAARLMQTADDPTAYQDVLARIDRLTMRFPQANTTALQVMLLQADYTRAETQIGQWISDPSQANMRSEAEQILVRITPKLQAHQHELNSQVEALFRELEELDDEQQADEAASKEKELGRVQAIAGRATYFAGWANYYLGVAVEDAAKAKNYFATSRQVFRRLLGVDDEETPYDKVQRDWLGLDSIWRARAVIGLGLAEAAAGHVESSRQVFDWLDYAAVAPEIRDQAAYWYVQGLINAGQLKPALDYAKTRVERFGGTATQGKTSLCVALFRAGFASEDNSAERDALGRLGIAGLAKLRQLSSLKTLIAKHDVDLSKIGGLFATWLQGQELYAAAEKSRDKADYHQAAEVLRNALATPEAKSEIAAAAQCRHLLAWCLYRQGEYAAAADQFEQAITGLKAIEGDAAVESAWMAFVAYKQLAADSPGATTSARAVLEQIKRDFPSSTFAAKADYQLARLGTATRSPEETIAALEKIAPDQSNYLSARYDLCLLLHGQWRAVSDQPAAAKSAAAKLQAAVDIYDEAASGKDVAERRLTCLLKVVDARLAKNSQDLVVANEYFRRAKPLADELGDNAAAAEFHSRGMQLARVTGDESARREHARWLVRNAAGTPFEAAALVSVAQAIEQQLKTSGANNAELNREAYEVYSRLSAKLGDSPDILKTTKNAKVAASRAAHFAAASGNHPAAAAKLASLLTAFPKDRNYLRRAGLAQFQVGEFDAALANWATLVRGLKPGSEPWYEAKYYQLASLKQTNATAAAAAIKQFRLLYPEQGGPTWRAKFSAL